jgi:hypothetical protein
MKYPALTAIVFGSLAFAAPAWGGIYTDDLARCLVKSASAQDRTVLLQWVFAAMSLHPVISGYSSISGEQRANISRSGGQLIERLLTVDCRTEAIAALKYERGMAIESSFGVLGQTAMKDLMSDQGVADGFGEAATYMDNEKMKELYEEGGGVPTEN